MTATNALHNTEQPLLPRTANSYEISSSNKHPLSYVIILITLYNTSK